jgi:hypothetical protein
VYGRRKISPYTARLLAADLARIAQKVAEEATEAVIEAVRRRQTAVIAESVDLIYNLKARDRPFRGQGPNGSLANAARDGRKNRRKTVRRPSMSEIAIFSGSAHPDLAAEICTHLSVPLLPSTLQRFANDCLGVQLEANCRERDVFLIQPLVPPVQEHLFELFLMLDAARGAPAARSTVVMPHYAYARSDKKDAPRISIAARLVADLLVSAGANRILTMTLHSPRT